MSDVRPRPRARIVRRGLVAVAALAVLASCGGDGSQGTATETADETASETVAGDDSISTTSAAPDQPSAGGGSGTGVLDVSGSLVGGGAIDLASYGDRPVLLWFWAPF